MNELDLLVVKADRGQVRALDSLGDDLAVHQHPIAVEDERRRVLRDQGERSCGSPGTNRVDHPAAASLIAA
jgi:hypothetical protein